MGTRLATVILAAALSLSATGADAARGISGTKETLMFVAETGLTGVESDTFALCHLVDQRTAFAIIPLSYSVKSYALADFGCNTNAYIALTADQVAELRRQGFIPADIPDAPTLPLRYTAYSWGVWALILATLGGMVAKRLSAFRGRKRPQRPKGRAGASFENKLVEVMMMTAGTDGQVDEREMHLMARAIARITGKTLDPSDIRQMITGANPPQTAADFHDFGVGLDDLQRIEVLRAALAMAVADGQIAPEERTFLDQLALGLMIPVTAIDTMLANAGLGKGTSAPVQAPA